MRKHDLQKEILHKALRRLVFRNNKQVISYAKLTVSSASDVFPLYSMQPKIYNSHFLVQ